MLIWSPPQGKICLYNIYFQYNATYKTLIYDYQFNFFVIEFGIGIWDYSDKSK